ncbi:MAG: holo-ACP synthase [Candidatus Omnitrophota bacterium]
MIFGTGLDIVETARIKDAARKWGDKFLDRVFTRHELDYSNGKKFIYQHLAARFAAKEAFFKAIGDSSISQIEWCDVEVVNDKFGKPTIRLSGAAKKAVAKKKISEIIISLSHTKNYAVANAILIK